MPAPMAQAASNTDRRKVAEAAMLGIMRSGEEFTFRQLYPVGNDAIGADHVGGGVAYRWADALIQKQRRAGNIKMVRFGVWVWIGEAA
jgi:hypothetical protein